MALNNLTIGFEWEVYQSEYYDEDTPFYNPDHDRFCWNSDIAVDFNTFRMCNRYNFRTHYECSAVEFASPVFPTLRSAKAMARRMQKRVAKDRFLGPGYTSENGIHVHVSYPFDADDFSERTNFYKRVYGMLNRSSSEAFVWKFSKRGECSDYQYEAESSCWDTYTDTPYFDGSGRMLRANLPDDEYTLEYRLWAGVSDRLIPALEFAHACTNFVHKNKKDKYPYLKDMKEWLFKQRAYNDLKACPEWDLI